MSLLSVGGPFPSKEYGPPTLSTPNERKASR